MNLKGLFLTTLITFSATNTIRANDIEQQEEVEKDNTKKQWADVRQAYATTFIAGGLIGGITGRIFKNIIRKLVVALPLAMLTLEEQKSLSKNDLILVFQQQQTICNLAIMATIGEIVLRRALVKEVNQIFEENSVKNRKDFTNTTAWIASWIAALL